MEYMDTEEAFEKASLAAKLPARCLAGSAFEKA
jgi:hypothetical protein